jgi:hypothetical protein
MARLTTSTKLIPGLAACTALRPRDAVSTRPLKLLIEQPIAAGLPGNAPSLHLALGRRSPILQRGSLWLAHRVVRAILRMAASGEADIRYLGGPARLAGVALYLAAERPLDRIRKRFRPIRVTIAPPRTQHTLRPPPRRKH